MHASNVKLIHQLRGTNDGRDSLYNHDEAGFKNYLISHKPNVQKNRDNYKKPQCQNLLDKSASADILEKSLDILRKIQRFSENSSKIGSNCMCIGTT